MANINLFIHKNHDILNDNSLININKISDDLMSMMSIAEEFLYHQLLCIDMNHSCGEEANNNIKIGSDRITAVGRV